MGKLILLPVSNYATEINLTPQPAAYSNFQCVNDFPQMVDNTFVHITNSTNYDHYNLLQIVSNLNLSISSVNFVCKCFKENTSNVCSAKTSFFSSNFRYSGSSVLLNDYITSVEESYSINPDTLPLAGVAVPDYWNINGINNIRAGVELTSGGAGTQARCSQFFVEVEFSVLGELVTNHDFPSDIIHVNQDYTISIEESKAISLINYSTCSILYQDPDGVTGSLSGNVFDNSKVIAKLPSLTNNKTGKWMFKLYCVLNTGEIIEGAPLFTNVQPRWS